MSEPTLSDKERSFVEHYRRLNNAAAAAELAGYQPGSAARLLSRPGVAEALKRGDGQPNAAGMADGAVLNIAKIADGEAPNTTGAAPNTVKTTDGAVTRAAKTADGAAPRITETADGAALNATETVDGAVSNAAKTADGAVSNAAKTADGAAPRITETADGAALNAAETADGAAPCTTETADGATPRITETTDGAAPCISESPEGADRPAGIASPDEVLSVLSEVLRSYRTDGRNNTSLKAAELLGRRMGLFTEPAADDLPPPVLIDDVRPPSDPPLRTTTGMEE